MPAVANPKSSPREIAGHHGHRPHGKSILWPALYEHLRRKGYSKEKAARISNSAWNKKHAGLPTNLPTSARGIAKLRAVAPWADGLVYKYDHSQEESVATIEKSDLPQEVVDYIDQLEAYTETVESERDEALTAVGTLTEQVTKLEADAGTASVEKGDPLAEVLAKADPVVRAVLEKQAKELEDQRAVITKAADDQFELTMIGKSAALSSITAPKDELTEMLKSVYKVDQELGDKVFKMLQDANTQVATSKLFTEFGKSGGDSTVGGAVESLAEEIRKGDPAMTKEQAIAAAYEANPALYNEELTRER